MDGHIVVALEVQVVQDVVVGIEWDNVLVVGPGDVGVEVGMKPVGMAEC